MRFLEFLGQLAPVLGGLWYLRGKLVKLETGMDHNHECLHDLKQDVAELYDLCKPAPKKKVSGFRR